MVQEEYSSVTLPAEPAPYTREASTLRFTPYQVSRVRDPQEVQTQRKPINITKRKTKYLQFLNEPPTPQKKKARVKAVVSWINK